MMTTARELPVTVVLTPPLVPVAAADVASLESAIGDDLEKLARDLSVGVRPRVRLEASTSELANDVMALFVDGRPCRFPPTMLAEALAYVDGSPMIPGNFGEVLDGLQNPGGDRLGRVLGLVSRAALSAQPGFLLTATDDDIAQAAVALGMSLADPDPTAQHSATNGDRTVERVIAGHASGTIDIEIHPSHLRAISDEHPSTEFFRFAHEGLFEELGLPLPDFRFRPNRSLHEAGFAFRFNAVRTLPRIGLPADTILVNETAERLAARGVEAEPTINPATNMPGALAAQAHTESLESEGSTTWDRGGFLILCLADAVRSNAYRLMTCDVADGLVRELGGMFPVLAGAAEGHLRPDELASVLRELLLDSVSIRNLRRILELLLRYEDDQYAANAGDRVTYVRSGSPTPSHSTPPAKPTRSLSISSRLRSKTRWPGCARGLTTWLSTGCRTRYAPR